eukprot:TRINITY_DN32699_c0_g1_i1.p1 TRINITY_DN32699_c0_g1~~TRINITY_DN32699_c0_g1_i1.p1  ORF type:complete len:142 (-),score=28.70 TRINITY_DN32699_c0_g1_i1:64-489(-)
MLRSLVGSEMCIRDSDRATEDATPPMSPATTSSSRASVGGGGTLKAPSKNTYGSTTAKQHRHSSTRSTTFPNEGGGDAEDLVKCDTMVRPMTTGSATYVYHQDSSDEGSTSALTPMTSAPMTMGRVTVSYTHLTLPTKRIV